MPSRSRDPGWRLTRARSSGLSESQVRQVDLRRRSFLTAGVAASPDPTSTSVVSNNIRRHLDARMTNSAALVTAPHSHIDQPLRGRKVIPVFACDGCLPQQGPIRDDYYNKSIVRKSPEKRPKIVPMSVITDLEQVVVYL